jgi:hypothetical protein
MACRGTALLLLFTFIQMDFGFKWQIVVTSSLLLSLPNGASQRWVASKNSFHLPRSTASLLIVTSLHAATRLTLVPRIPEFLASILYPQSELQSLGTSPQPLLSFSPYPTVSNLPILLYVNKLDKASLN